MLKDKHRAKRCFIVGNGVSLRQQELGKLKTEFVFVTNWFVLHHHFYGFRNCFYCVADPHFFNFGVAINSSLSRYLAKHHRIALFSEMAFKPLFEKESILSNKKIVYLSIDLSKKVWDGNFSTNLFSHVCWGHSTIIDLCLPLAYFMGFETIYLLGCDCNYNLQKSADFSDSYFYSISDIPGDDYSNIQRQKDEGLFAGFEAVFESSYSTVKRYFEQHDRQIFNAGINGKLEVFPRVDFDSLF